MPFQGNGKTLKQKLSVSNSFKSGGNSTFSKNNHKSTTIQNTMHGF